MATGQIVRGLSHLPVMTGKEAEFLNRELVPVVRELIAALSTAGTLIDSLQERVDALEDAVFGP